MRKEEEKKGCLFEGGFHCLQARSWPYSTLSFMLPRHRHSIGLMHLEKHLEYFMTQGAYSYRFNGSIQKTSFDLDISKE